MNPIRTYVPTSTLNESIWKRDLCPIVKGEGRRLFTGNHPSGFKITGCRAAPSGMLLVSLGVE